MKKEILLINPRIGLTQSLTPHLGLAVLATRLEQAGHTVVTLDYSAEHSTPPLDECLRRYEPDFVGITGLTSGVGIVRRLISIIGRYNENIVVALGGPHATLYPEDLRAIADLDYIVQGEAEDRIADLVDAAVAGQFPEIVSCERPPIDKFPMPSFCSFHNFQNISVYPLLTSKGCPFNCSFCSVHKITSRAWRRRRIDDCIEEVSEARHYLPRLRHVRIIDDEPAVDRERFQLLLSRFAEARRGLSLEIVNLRAKDITQETLGLMREAGVFEVCFGVEHGNPTVFEHIEKGETLEDIARAAELVKSSGLFLRCCFIVGLPFDSYERTLESIEFAKKIKADFIHWNSFIPLRGTRAADWFSAHGRVFDTKEQFSLSGSGGFFVPEPCVETDDFKKEDRKKAYALALLETGSYVLTPRGLVEILRAMFRYELYASTLKSLVRQPGRIFKTLLRFRKAGLLSGYARRYFKGTFSQSSAGE
ncbi:MAG: radical SAM protein [Candidatus Abyssobacteria bacterium SURF_17]|uniref:Radical SAM protein n=1 Tax=Candidatus Abyssobacteria bacterium SURF_17 TaxID=2093361 RepID=A0A419F304_9BACT|nr:MAG: radical SAM protein [Candidatus Abyssubacteria bacterium SURF_17]